MATPSRILAWKIPWTEEPGRLQSMGSQRVGHDWAAKTDLGNVVFFIILILPIQEHGVSPSACVIFGFLASIFTHLSRHFVRVILGRELRAGRWRWIGTHSGLRQLLGLGKSRDWDPPWRRNWDSWTECGLGDEEIKIKGVSDLSKQEAGGASYREKKNMGSFNGGRGSRAPRAPVFPLLENKRASAGVRVCVF